MIIKFPINKICINPRVNPRVTRDGLMTVELAG